MLCETVFDKFVSDYEINLFVDKFINPTKPSIENLDWHPIREINGKIYDIKVTFVAKDDKTKISHAELRFIPERYDYFITKYEMRSEDYDKVFKPENERILASIPKDGRFDELQEEFEVPIMSRGIKDN